jgi:GNAT superfamily N-acetyltransferase
LIGCLGILRRTVAVGERDIRVGGIAGVITHSEWRRRGVTSALLKEAVGFIGHHLGCEFGLLLCRKEIVSVYAQGGWRRVDGPTRFSQPSGKQTYPGATMIYQCTGRPWPPGPIDLCGLPW